MLRYSILWWSVPNSSMLNNTMLFTKLVEFIITKFQTIIYPQALYFLPSLVFHQYFSVIEMAKYFILVFQKINSDFARVIINKCQQVLIITFKRYTRWTPKIRMDIVESTFCGMCGCTKLHPTLLPEHVMFIKVE